MTDATTPIDPQAPEKKKRVRKPKAPPPPPPRLGMRPMLVTALLIMLLDQALKYVVVHVMQLDRVREINLLDPWLNLRMAWNQGVNFGLFSSSQDMMRWILIAVALLVCLWVGLWVWKTRAGRFVGVAAGLLIGGAIGNVIDRLTYGAVADFLNMSLPFWQNPYSFNVADIAIFLGAIGLIVQPPRQPEAGVAAKKPARPRKPAIGAADKPRDGGEKPR